MAVLANRPLKDQGDKLGAISAAKMDGNAGLVAAHLKRVRGANTMEHEVTSAQMQDVRQKIDSKKMRGSN